MSEVTYFNQVSLSKETIKQTLKDKFLENERVVIKLHFGEPGNETALTPKDVKPYVEAIQELGHEVLMVDTPVAYDSPRNSKEGYEKAIKERGYDEVGPYTVSDEYINSELGGYTFEVAKELAEAKNVLVLSHVKGHACAGFGGAIKNLGMGALSKESKMLIHGGSKPVIDKEKCIGCEVCTRLCPANAITMKDGKADPNLDMCWGCSICQINCASEALTPKSDIFDKLLALGGVSAMNLMPKTTFYFNIIKNITQFCDCEEDSGEIIANDLGTLFSQNPVAIDNASVDLINKKEGKDVFKEMNNKDPKLQIQYAQEVSDFEMEYNLDKD
jgi:uncharacterized Fe-S center protein